VAVRPTYQSQGNALLIALRTELDALKCKFSGCSSKRLMTIFISCPAVTSSGTHASVSNHGASGQGTTAVWQKVGIGVLADQNKIAMLHIGWSEKIGRMRAEIPKAAGRPKNNSESGFNNLGKSSADKAG